MAWLWSNVAVGVVAVAVLSLSVVVDEVRLVFHCPSP